MYWSRDGKTIPLAGRSDLDAVLSDCVRQKTADFEDRERLCHAHKNGRAHARPFTTSDAICAQQRSAGGVPTVRKRNQWPSQPIVVGCPWRRAEDRQMGHHRVLPGNSRNGRSHHVQQALELNFTHRDLRIEGTRSQNSFFSGLSWSLKLYRSGDRGSKMVTGFFHFPRWTT